MKRGFIKLFSLILITALTACIFTACTEETITNKEENFTNESIPLVIGEANFSENFSPFFYESVPDGEIAEITGVYLINSDREGLLVEKGIEGETRNYNGTDYTYYGPADMTITIDEEKNETTYHFKLREDITFSDGTPITADDVIFTYYVLADPSYDGNSTLYSVPIKGMADYRSAGSCKNEEKTSANIEGIQKLGKYEFQVITNGFDAKAVYNIANIIIAPMHYYGNASLYNYENNQFGFTKGDLSGVHNKDNMPLGAGAYKFIKYENKIVYLEANENYFAGKPKIKNIQWKETSDADKIPAVRQGILDLAMPSASKISLKQIAGINKNGQLNGETIATRFHDYSGYGYIGMNADRICVNGKRDSKASKYLRSALATVISVYRDVTINTYYGDAADVINYPISNTSWAAPEKSDSDFSVAFSTDWEGVPIYTEDMSVESKYSAALKAATDYLKAAGYTITNGRVTAVPKGGKTEYEVWIGADGTGDHPSFGILTDAKEALASIGITLTINDVTDTSKLWNGLDAGNVDMWCAAWQSATDPDLYQNYYSANIIGQGGSDSNYYHIADEELDRLIMDARTSNEHSYRKSVYKQCFDIIMDWAVEIPVYQRQECLIFSPERINADTFPTDISTFYPWYREIEKMEMT